MSETKLQFSETEKKRLYDFFYILHKVSEREKKKAKDEANKSSGNAISAENSHLLEKEPEPNRHT